MASPSRVIYRIFLIYNVLWGLIGIMLIAYGGDNIFRMNYYFDASYFRITSITSIILGISVLTLSVIGYVSCFNEQAGLTIAYIIIISTKIIIQIVSAILIYVRVDFYGGQARDFISKVWESSQFSSKYAAYLNSIQLNLKCCGFTGPDDWGINLPPSCCDREYFACLMENAYRIGCGQKFMDFKKELTFAAIAIFVTVSAIEIVGLVVAVVYLWVIRHRPVEEQTRNQVTVIDHVFEKADFDMTGN